MLPHRGQVTCRAMERLILPRKSNVKKLYSVTCHFGVVCVWGGEVGGHYLFKDAVMSYLDVRRRVRDCLEHSGLVRRCQEGPRTNLDGRNLSHPRVGDGAGTEEARGLRSGCEKVILLG